MVTLTVDVSEAWVTEDIKYSFLLSGKGSIERYIQVLFPFSYCPRSQWTVPNSAIHKAAGSLATGRSLQNGKKCRWQERPPRDISCSPIHSFRDGMVEWWNSTSQIM